jgi:hypothetical protein
MMTETLVLVFYTMAVTALTLTAATLLAVVIASVVLLFNDRR